MAGEKLGLGTGIHRLKLGESFSKNSNTAFHTIRYDFKPASVDTKKMAGVEIGSNNQVTVTVPHIEGSGISHTVFKGPRRPTKECVLIIDNSTGEIVLERLTNSIQLKKTRAEGSSKMQPPTSLVEPPPTKEQLQQLQISQQTSQTNKKLSPTQKYSPVQRPSQSPGRRLSPKHLSPNRNSPTNLTQRSPANQRSPSMPSLIPPSVNNSSNNKPPTLAFVKEGSMPIFTSDNLRGTVEPMDTSASEVGILSDSSNSSSNSDSSSSSDSSDSENEEPAHMPVISPAVNSTQRPNVMMNGHSKDKSSIKRLAASMPQFNQLSEDLHLSESGSDSD